MALFAGIREGVDDVEEDEGGACGGTDGGAGGGGTEEDIAVDEGADFLAERGGLGGFIVTSGTNGTVWDGTVWGGSISENNVWDWVEIACDGDGWDWGGTICDGNCWDWDGSICD